MPVSKPSAILTLFLSTVALCGCGEDANQKILGKWLSMRDGKPVEFSEKQMKASDGIQVLDSYQVEGDKVTVYMTKGGSKVGTEYILSEGGKKACAGPELDSCIVRPDRAGKLEGMWALDENNPAAPSTFAITPTIIMTALGNFRLEKIRLDNNNVTFNMRDDRALINEPPTRSMEPSTFVFNGDDALCKPKKVGADPAVPEPKCLTRVKKKS